LVRYFTFAEPQFFDEPFRIGFCCLVLSKPNDLWNMIGEYTWCAHTHKSNPTTNDDGSNWDARTTRDTHNKNKSAMPFHEVP
jgi:hypothetical protein